MKEQNNKESKGYFYKKGSAEWWNIIGKLLVILPKRSIAEEQRLSRISKEKAAARRNAFDDDDID